MAQRTDRTLAEWKLTYTRWSREEEPLREALCTLGNGWFATRGAAEEHSAGGPHYPGTYLAGGYDRQESLIGGRWISNEALVNWPNWLVLTFRIEGGPWLDLDAMDVIDLRQELDMRDGVLTRRFVVKDERERVTELLSRRIVHMGSAHLGAIEWRLWPRNWSGRVEVRSALDGNVVNAGVARYRELEGHHLDLIGTGLAGEDCVHLTVETRQSKLRMTQAARLRVWVDEEPASIDRRTLEHPGLVVQELECDMGRARCLRVEKVVAIHTVRDRAISDPLDAAAHAAREAPSFDALLASHARAWHRVWSWCDIRIAESDASPDTQAILRLHLFHLLQSVSVHTIDLDVGVAARGLHGEAYRGHVFWDELFIVPLLNLSAPEITRALLSYRYRRLPAARRLARAAGYEGAMFPWQSGSDGREESPTTHLNPRSNRWIPDETHLQRHVGAAVAYNAWRYFEATCDQEFLAYYGAEMILDIARFWASVAVFDAKDGRYHIRGVVGPDEYHTRYPGAEAPGIDDNAYTNVMAAWTLDTALRCLRAIDEHRRSELFAELGMTDDDARRFREVASKMAVPFMEDGLIAQFEGYHRLEELDWDACRRRHGDIQRLDRVLEAEGDSPNRYKASKQADVLMLFYLFSAEELARLFEKMGYPFDPQSIPANIDYYAARTSHGSSLSRVVHSWVLSRADRPGSYELFQQALRADIEDTQGGTSAEGIHLGAMAGTVDIAQRCYAGIETREGVLWLNPRLPRELTRIELPARYRGHWLDLQITHESVRVAFRRGISPKVRVGVRGEVHTFEQGQSREIPLARAQIEHD